MIPAKPACKTNMEFHLAARERDRIIVVDVVGRPQEVPDQSRGRGFRSQQWPGELTRCFCSVRQAGGEMKLVHVNARVQTLLEMTRINNLFDIHSEEHAALEAFR
jgi:hypothetical protein